MLDSPTSMVSIDHSKDFATKSSLRSVKFKETPTLVLLPDDADTKAARRGPWEMLARDRARFKRRIKQTEDAISWIFEQTHRDQARARLATGRIDCTECHPVGHDASASTSMDRVRYESEIHRKLYQNDHPFVLRKYDGRMKKCRGCHKAFKSVGVDRPKFVVAHEELYVYGRAHPSKRLLMAERHFFYHDDPACILPHHPYYDASDVTTYEDHHSR